MILLAVLYLQRDGRSWFVDTAYLMGLGGQVFSEWDEMKSKGVKRHVVVELAAYELECLIEATCKYRQILITR